GVAPEPVVLAHVRLIRPRLLGTYLPQRQFAAGRQEVGAVQDRADARGAVRGQAVGPAERTRQCAGVERARRTARACQLLQGGGRLAELGAVELRRIADHTQVARAEQPAPLRELELRAEQPAQERL